MTTLRETLIKIGAEVVRHAKAVTFQLAEVAVPRALFAAILGGSVGCERRRARDERSPRAGGSDVEPRRTGMVRREVRGDVEDRAVRGPSRRSIGHPARRTPRSRRLIPWTRAFGPSPIRVQEARARSRTARSTLIWEIPGQVAGSNRQASQEALMVPNRLLMPERDRFSHLVRGDFHEDLGD